MSRTASAAPAIAVALAVIGAQAPARADAIDKLGKRLIALEAEVANLSSGIRKPSTIGPQSSDLAGRRLIDARLNFGVGNFDDAAVQLYDFVEKYKSNPSWDEGLYYLAESLYQKGDFVAARTYFKQLVEEVPQSKFYQQSLERLIELTLKLGDAEDVDRWLSALDNIHVSKQRASVPYVRGKYAYFKEQYDEALTWFAKVPKGSEYDLQTRYFTGVCHIAKGEIAEAAGVFQKLVRAKAKSKEHKRVVELAHMAMGRLYYERDQPSKAVDAYLRIHRKSDLFDEALYEVSWVYVKAKQFDKALRALELLALADPTSQKMPEVRILEGNLRIRKAMRISEQGTGNSKEEYDRAQGLFEDTKEAFFEPRQELDRLIAEQGDARAFMDQITGRNSETFDVKATLPPVAAAWLRREPEVTRVVEIESDLGQIETEIKEAERTIARLDTALNSPSKVNIFPSLATKRIRAIEIMEELFAIRTQLATHERALIGKYASGSEKAQLESLQKRRQEIARQLEALPDAELAESERIGAARGRFDTLDQKAAEVSTIIGTVEAQLVALEKYVLDQGINLERPESAEVKVTMEELRTEIDTLNSDLAAVREQMVHARDRAGTGDETALKREQLRVQLRAALDDEHRYLMQLVGKMAGGDRTKAEQIASLTQKANGVTVKLDEMTSTIEQIVEVALAEVRGNLEEERSKLDAYRQEFSQYETESRELGGQVLVLGFDAVAVKFYEILIQSDVGIVDVAWSLKESADQTAKRLTLEQARQRKTLDADFADVIKEIREQKQREFEDKQKKGGQE